MLSALIVVGVPSAVGLAGWLCHREGYDRGYSTGYAEACEDEK
jgi:hypothetical protein